MADYQIWAWGSNGNGQLGTNDTTSYSSPVSVVGQNSYVDLSYGSNFSLAIDSNGMIWAWGSGGSGALGNNDTTNYSSPISIARSSSYSKLTCGYKSGYAIEGSTGKIYAWGANNYGQLGINSTTYYSSPVFIAKTDSFVNINAGGADHCLAIDASGIILSWGYNIDGCLGVGNTNNYSSPVSILRTASYKEIAIGGEAGSKAFCLAIDGSNGSIWSWGNNEYGQLGVNDAVSYSSPVSVIGIRSYSKISCGDAHSLAIDSSTGMVYTWGGNWAGQLGANNKVYASSPVAIARSASYVSIAGGLTCSFAIDSDGVVWAWGINPGGRLGTNSTTNYSSPVSIARTAHYFKVAAYAQSSDDCQGAIEGPFQGNPTITSTGCTLANTISNYRCQMTADDPGMGTLTWSLTTSPAGMSVGSSSGLITWIPTSGQLGNHSVTVQVENEVGGTDTLSYTVEVKAGPAERPQSGSSNDGVGMVAESFVGTSAGVPRMIANIVRILRNLSRRRDIF